ncbi:MAG: hypothetical protein J0L77_02045 [Alphaproteobacteria bacterium]|nr:hypothetical protein [Alphaproteobacteria bacterium]
MSLTNQLGQANKVVFDRHIDGLSVPIGDTHVISTFAQSGGKAFVQGFDYVKEEEFIRVMNMPATEKPLGSLRNELIAFIKEHKDSFIKNGDVIAEAPELPSDALQREAIKVDGVKTATPRQESTSPAPHALELDINARTGAVSSPGLRK